MHHRFLSDLHSILENTEPNTAEYDSAVTDLATLFLHLMITKMSSFTWSICLSMKEKVKTTR